MTEIRLRGADGPQTGVVLSMREDRKEVVNLVIFRTDIEETLGVNLDQAASDALIRGLELLWETLMTARLVRAGVEATGE